MHSLLWLQGRNDAQRVPNVAAMADSETPGRVSCMERVIATAEMLADLRSKESSAADLIHLPSKSAAVGLQADRHTLLMQSRVSDAKQARHTLTGASTDVEAACLPAAGPLQAGVLHAMLMLARRESCGRHRYHTLHRFCQ